MLDKIENISGNGDAKKKIKGHQPSIIDMFQQKTKRKFESIDSNTEKTEEENVELEGKRKKIENIDPNGIDSAQQCDTGITVKKPTSTFANAKCKQCRQILEDIEEFPGDPSDSCEEFVALTHELLSVFVGNEETGRPQHKITNFCVYDKNAHLCPFDAGLIEKNVELFFSGVIKPVYDEDISVENGVRGTRLGPINEWWTAGFDGGENALVGLSTAFADYFLASPHPSYENQWSSMQEKIYMSKIVIEFLSESIEANYEDLVYKIQSSVPPANINVLKFTEESLLRHAQFVVEQVESFDSSRGDDEDALVGHPCMRDLVHLAGVTLGKRRGIRNRVIKEKKVVKASSTKATTTELVAFVTESFFKGTVDSKVSADRRKRCGVCEKCQLPDCRKCSACKDMTKYGGSGKSKQSCVERRCLNMQYSGEIESDTDEQNDELPDKKPVMKNRGLKRSKKKLNWIGGPLATQDGGKKVFYERVKINDEEVAVGDCVSVLLEKDDEEVAVGTVVMLWEEDGKKMMHIDWFIRASETILGEVADTAELFLFDECENRSLDFVSSKVVVEIISAPDNWCMMGGEPYKNHSYDGVKTFFCQKWYDEEVARFEDPPSHGDMDCQSCHRMGLKEESRIPTAIDELRTEGNKVLYKKARYEGVTYGVGDSLYLPVDAFDFDLTVSKPEDLPNKKSNKADPVKYPEMYRKSTKHIKGSNENVPDPFKIGRILSIFRNSRKDREVKLEIAKFYRTENTHKEIEESYYCDLNLLYWSEETAIVKLRSAQGKCTVKYEYDLKTSLAEYTSASPDRFYFNESYDAKTKTFDEPPLSARDAGLSSKKTNVKVNAKIMKTVKESKGELEKPVRQIKKLRTLDVFAGCGGLSEGFHQAGIAESCYAIELWEPAAQAYRLNNPGATVFTEDCNVLLRRIMDGKEKNLCGQKLPQKGDIELLCGGPPCQGFSGMNRFNSREYSRFKNSLVVSYLSYCDYFRPRFFLLENVRNFVSFKNCMVLKLTLASLVKMGYQCTFGVLQAGHYGIAQTRRRAIILAAAPGEKLPFYPEPVHSFSLKSGSLIAQVDDKRYMNNITRASSAPLRTITVRDTMSDLPKIPNGFSKLEQPYSMEARSHFQRMIRDSRYQPVLRDHICKDMNPLVEARMTYIPHTPGSDWRDLPNIQVKLSDGTTSKLLRYTHNDKKQGKGPNGALRGVCACATGQPCDPMDRQFNTLVPWCLPHTGNRHNHWAGLYGRLDWDGFFSTTVTNPEPMGKQGRVLHPEQHRVVSVRECARSQGFPDTYRFFGTILDKHREVGNAVPPPMAKAIGLEIKKCLEWKVEKKDKEDC